MGANQWLLIHLDDAGLSVGASSVPPPPKIRGLCFYHPASLHYLCVGALPGWKALESLLENIPGPEVLAVEEYKADTQRGSQM